LPKIRENAKVSSFKVKRLCLWIHY